jgi:2-oxoglutarate dehydrogenase E1 component
MHLPQPDRIRWLADRLEEKAISVDQAGVLELLARGEVFEEILQTTYPGAKRFSVEGVASLLPLLEDMVGGAARMGAQEVLLGMSHRGRLAVITTIVRRPPRELVAGFEDVDPRSVLGGGDVKYHLGANSIRVLPDGRRLRVSLASNPSHLEAVDPVVLGRARARQSRRGGVGQVLPILLHGDAAFAGQGMVAETLNLADLPGYTVGGTIHLVLNNLIGFTTPPSALHSSRLATEVAKRLPIPILHVNGEDPEAVLRAGRIALAYRWHWKSDVVIDLVGFRRHGHSEIEDPTTTQPALYRRIQNIPPLYRSYGTRVGRPVEPLVERLRTEFRHEIEEARKLDRLPPLREMPEWWDGFEGGPWRPEFEVETAVPRERLGEIARRLRELPPGFRPHPKIAALLEERYRMGQGARAVDWGGAEALALGSLLGEGIRVRLSGQDARRGTFNQRHAVLFGLDQEEEHVPLGTLGTPFECLDSPLSEAAPLGFEFGFSRDYPEALVLWEAQFGDFANGGQSIIDQFVSSSEDKWGLLSGLVLLLPHGYEGQGPEHSSARLERFLQLAAEDNMEIVQPTTAAQYFHVLRRQALRRWRKPLIVLTPKGYLRRPESASPLVDFTSGGFQSVLGDDRPGARRIFLCTGKVSHELRRERDRRGEEDTAVLALEKLYPFPEEELEDELSSFPEAREVVFVQEEPANMGALSFVHPILDRLGGRYRIRSVKRSPSASPATGSAKAHALEERALLELAFSVSEAEALPLDPPAEDRPEPLAAPPPSYPGA